MTESEQDPLPADPAVLAGPVPGSERLASLDTLRGVAISGILVMNIYAFAMPSGAYDNPLLMGGTELHNLGTWLFTHVFFDQKFLSIFAMLFGAGIVLIAERAERRGTKPGPIYYRRQFWLLIIGAAHAYLVWDGDILFTYAAVGMLAYAFRRRSPRALLVIACCFLPVTLLIMLGFSNQLVDMRATAIGYQGMQANGEALSADQEAFIKDWEATRQSMVPAAESLQEEVEVFSGGYAHILAYRIPEVMATQVFMLLALSWWIVALMLIGMALAKLRIITGARSAQFYRTLMLAGYVAGLPLTVYSAIDLQAHDFDKLYALGIGGVPNYLGSILVALGHIGLVMLIVKTGYLQDLMRRFAAVGRMALSNYLLHSLILTTVFYGYGLGLFGRVPRFWQMGFVLAVIALQLVLSPWWLARYRFGPAEWLWRSLSYWRRQPMRQPATA